MSAAEMGPQGWASRWISLPPALHASVRRHQEHLVALVGSLRAAGVDESVVEVSVRQLVNSYGVELTAAIRTLVLGPAND